MSRILFVCTGNICRSPTAEAVFRSRAEAAGLHDIAAAADSAGTHGYHVGQAPDPRAQDHARRRGYDLTGLVARQVEDADFQRFDLVLALDRGHLRLLQRLAGNAGDRAAIGLFLDHAEGSAAGQDVPDPYYGGAAAFDQALDLIETGVDGLIARLRAGALPG
jgi:protein-tyrosine phosphatase